MLFSKEYLHQGEELFNCIITNELCTSIDKYISKLKVPIFPTKTQLNNIGKKLGSTFGFKYLGGGSDRFTYEINGYALKIEYSRVLDSAIEAEEELVTYLQINKQYRLIDCLAIPIISRGSLALYPLCNPCKLGKAKAREFVNRLIRDLEESASVVLHDVAKYDNLGVYNGAILVLDYAEWYSTLDSYNNTKRQLQVKELYSVFK